MDFTHDELCDFAQLYLKKNGFGVVFGDRFRASTLYGEQPDTLGFRSGVSCLVEVKVSRSDFLADKRKKFRKDPDKGMGDWRFYMCPKGLIKVEELPEGWGLLEVADNGKVKRHGWPTNAMWISKKPLTGNKHCETMYMYSALRRMEIRGHLKEVYEGMPQ